MRTVIHPLTLVVAAGVVVLALLPLGCSSKEARAARDVAAMNTSNVQRLGNMYAAFQNFKGGRGPNDLAEFKGFIKEYPESRLGPMGIDPSNIEALFNSDRDGKPFKIRYKVGGGRGSSDPVIFEQDGQAGKKQVAYTGGKVEEVDDATYQRLWTGARSGGGRPSGAPPGAPAGPKDKGGR